MKKIEILERLETMSARSAWKKGVLLYAMLIIENLDDDVEITEKVALNGATNWKEYSYGGSALIYDKDIAEMTCNLSELRLTRNGERHPNSRETWLDVQARALFQAWELIKSIR